MGKKDLLKKKRLGNAEKRAVRSVPLFAVARTDRKVKYNSKVRHWRARKLKI
jgi:ribosomal protein L39E